MRYIDNYDVLLFDVQMTIMYDVDRFSETENFHAAYRKFGGALLSPQEVRTAILRCFNYLLPHYNNPEFFDCFPSLEDAFNTSCPDLSLSPNELNILMKTFAFHECGHIPDDYAYCIKELAKTHKLGVVSNIWAKKETWILEFENKKILDCFEVLIFSSDYKCIKPSPSLFHQAMRSFNAPHDRFVFIGDSPAYDIAGAQAAGIDAILTTNNKPAPRGFDHKPVHIVPNLHHLLLF